MSSICFRTRFCYYMDSKQIYMYTDNFDSCFLIRHSSFFVQLSHPSHCMTAFSTYFLEEHLLAEFFLHLLCDFKKSTSCHHVLTWNCKNRNWTFHYEHSFAWRIVPQNIVQLHFLYDSPVSAYSRFPSNERKLIP